MFSSLCGILRACAFVYVRVSQQLQGENMMSAAAYQPKMEVSEVEMIDGRVTGGAAGLMDDPTARTDEVFCCLVW